ncbi:MAG: DoxX family membrane protein, partial [Anaerolineales bacterium]|nr:DoxX family membrane protein [Anaerolineales bacterium]
FAGTNLLPERLSFCQLLMCIGARFAPETSLINLYPLLHFELLIHMTQNITSLFKYLDARITQWMARYGILLLRISMGLVFLWFGALKFFPGLSLAADLATRTIERLTFGLIAPDVSILILAVWESLIGLGLILGIFMRATLLLLFLQMLGTISPIFLFPQEVFTAFPYAPTLEGQYIFKNMVFISAGLVIGATVRGGRVVADPAVVRRGV